MDISKSHLGKAAVTLILVSLMLWQLSLIYTAKEFASLFKDFGGESDLSVFVSASQPFMWVFSLTTLVVLIDILKRNNILIINTLSIIAAIAIGTIFLQIMVMLGGYLPIIELGNVN